MARRKRHPKPEIEAALKYIEQNGWRIEVGGSHAWGKILCPYNDEKCRGGMRCRVSIFSTPRNPGDHSKLLRRAVDKCIRHNLIDEPGTNEE
ncbi:hypothetical protein Pse7367_3048 [Thalassoporum mexicanum PCC 7367]|uniref:hypothetical protein n=1 Tax=Thalassoporum mexicanum TaxID=3457544 RepID=UPI00029FCC71|nr:hypothetical protein [Pseudanabaena sp. PCC 7367]AFY71297.1 hypothetical protein Pse7367_3048 [Pseudanabaena sp. PCC 7367]